MINVEIFRCVTPHPAGGNPGRAWEVEYYLYDPLLESYDQSKIKSYSWICSAPDDRGETLGEMMYWNWTVTYKIGDYWDTEPRLGPS